MSNQFTNRVYGCAIIKSINSNYNADFSNRPRTLPNGVVYATDKTLKWAVRSYWKNALDERVFYSKSLDEKMSPRTLDETYEFHFSKKATEAGKTEVLKNLLSCVDVRIFGGTYAVKSTNISIHGTCQISHGVNRFPENIIYSEQIMSPFSNSGKEEAQQTTLGSQTKLAEGHYVHHFSVNPKNIVADAERVEAQKLSNDDIVILKEALRKGVSYYDSSSKIGTDNECLLWVQLKEGSNIIMPSFIDYVTIDKDRNIDMTNLAEFLVKFKNDIEAVELYYDKKNTKVMGLDTVDNLKINSI